MRRARIVVFETGAIPFRFLRGESTTIYASSKLNRVGRRAARYDSGLWAHKCNRPAHKRPAPHRIAGEQIACSRSRCGNLSIIPHLFFHREFPAPMNLHLSPRSGQPPFPHNHARYDAAGQRVRRAVPGSGITDDYLYDLAGEYITQVSGGGFWIRGEIYAGGRHLATYENDLQTPTTFFEHTDWLGTERVETAVNGTGCETIQSVAFGDGLGTSGSCDPSAKYFTGKERDWESNLDNFEARYYSSQIGRFMTADWSAIPAPVPYANFSNPQTLNLYAIVSDNPETFADLDGHYSAYTAPTAGGGMDLTGFSSDDSYTSIGYGEFGGPPSENQAQPAQITFNALLKNYPTQEDHPTDPNAPNSIWSLIGGNVEKYEWTKDQNGNAVESNSCAVRMSYDLNKSGLTIPKGKGTFSGADGKQYFLRVADLQKFITRSLGPPQVLHGGGWSGPEGKSGIISFNIPFRDATGHFSLWNGASLIDRNSEGYDRWRAATSTLFWRVP